MFVWFWRLLRFLNLLEPGRHILSITKIGMWLALFWVSWGMYYGSQDVTAVISLFSIGSLYSWRRYVQWKTGKIDPTPNSEGM